MAQNPDPMDAGKPSDDSEIDPDASPSRDSEDADTGGEMENDEAKITLSKEQLEQCGLGHLEPGDAFTVTLKGTVTDKGDDEGIMADVDELSDGQMEGVIPPPNPLKPAARQGPMVKGPQAAGMMTPASSPMLPDDMQ